MKLELNEKEVLTLVEMLTMAGYVLTQAEDEALVKAEAMHELIQKIYQQAKAEHLPDSFETDEESEMIFPNNEIMTGAEDSPLFLLKSYNEFAAADVLSQQLGLRDAAKQHNIQADELSSDIDPAFIQAFLENQSSYLEEFARNGFDNVQVSCIQLK